MLAFLLVAAFVYSAFGCRCIPQTLHQTYYSKDVVNYVKATVLSSSTDKQPDLIQYVLSVEKNYKGCTLGKTVAVYSLADSTGCSVTLNVGSRYVLPVREGKTPGIKLCDVSWASICVSFSPLLLRTYVQRF